MMNNKLLKRTMTTDMVVALVSGTLPEKHGVAELFVTTVLARGDGEDIRQGIILRANESILPSYSAYADGAQAIKVDVIKISC